MGVLHGRQLDLLHEHWGEHGLESQILEHHLGKPEQLEAPTEPHWKSGYPIPVGTQRRLALPTDEHPVVHPEGFKERRPLEFNVKEFPPQEPGKFGPLEGMLPTTQEPVRHVYRAMHVDEWNQALKEGVIRSDERGAIVPGWEGTNAGLDRETAQSYMPMADHSVIAKIAVHPDDEWFSSNADGYARTRKPIPLDRVVGVTPELRRAGDEELLSRTQAARQRVRETHGENYMLHRGDVVRI